MNQPTPDPVLGALRDAIARAAAEAGYTLTEPTADPDHGGAARRPTASEITDDELDALHARAERAERERDTANAIAEGNKRHVRYAIEEAGREAVRADRAEQRVDALRRRLGIAHAARDAALQRATTAEATVAWVGALHYRYESGPNARCHVDEEPWPCDTIRALGEAAPAKEADR